MKIRNGFVSNSSSSSFVISTKNITGAQFTLILEHIEHGKEYDMEFCDREDAWDINMKYNKAVSGYTSMDNFDMYEYFEKIGIDMSKVKWGE